MCDNKPEPRRIPMPSGAGDPSADLQKQEQVSPDLMAQALIHFLIRGTDPKSNCKNTHIGVSIWEESISLDNDVVELHKESQ
jgi:hypothetical protein